MEVVLTSPHGEELLDAGFAVSGDVAVAGEARMVEVLAGWLAERGVPEAIGPAEDLAAMTVAALNGLKSKVKTLDALRAGEARLAALIARAMV